MYGGAFSGSTCSFLVGDQYIKGFFYFEMTLPVLDWKLLRQILYLAMELVVGIKNVNVINSITLDSPSNASCVIQNGIKIISSICGFEYV